MSFRLIIVSIACCLPTLRAAEPVTLDNFVRAETDTYFARFVKEGGFGRLQHERDVVAIDRQTVIRMNRDTLYSSAVLDLDAGPVTVTIPDAGRRFLALQIVNEDHYTTDVLYRPGAHQLTKERIGTRYVGILGRTFVNPTDPGDVKQVHALQDALRLEQARPGKFEIPEWDQESLTKIRQALNALAAASGGVDSTRMFGSKADVDPVQHLVGTAAGWGGNPRATALYVGGRVAENDGRHAYTLTVKDVPVDGFWSISVYNKDGFFEKNPQNAYTLNNITAKPNADGSYTIRFGGCDGQTPNCLPISPGWNYIIRLYRPRKEILDGSWTFPAAELVK